MSPETGDQTVLERLPQFTEMLNQPIYPPQSPNDSASAADVALRDPDDSEAETERLHLSPTKKRLATEIELENMRKRAKLAGRDCPIALSCPTDDEEAGLPTNGASAERASGSRTNIHPKKEPTSDKADINDTATFNGEMRPAEVLVPIGAADSEANHDSEANPPDETHHDEETNHEDEAEIETKTAEDHVELERLRAIQSLSDIEATLSQVCDRLHEQQLMKFDLEIKMCSEGTHPSLRQYRDRINGELEEKLTRIGNLLCYQMNSIHTESRAGRCAAVQTYMKNRFQLRTEMLNAVTERWYKTNRERQQMTMGVPEYGYSATGVPRNVRRVPVTKMGVKTHRALLKMPAAPSMPYLTDAERDEDLRSLGLR